MEAVWVSVAMMRMCPPQAGQTELGEMSKTRASRRAQDAMVADQIESRRRHQGSRFFYQFFG